MPGPHCLRHQKPAHGTISVSQRRHTSWSCSLKTGAGFAQSFGQCAWSTPHLSNKAAHKRRRITFAAWLSAPIDHHPQPPVSPQSRQVVQVPVRTTGGPELHRHFHTPFYFFCCRASRRAPNIFAMSSLVFGRVSGNISKSNTTDAGNDFA